MDPFAFAKRLSPAKLKQLADRRLEEVVVQEIGRSKKRVGTLEERYPSSPPRERAQRLIDEKKAIAGMVGGVSGIFGLVSVPADLVAMAWLEIVLLVDIAHVYRINLKTDGARDELLDLFGYANGIGPLQRSGPKVLGKIAGTLLERGGLGTVGRAVPLIAAPISAYLNNQHIQKVGDEAIRHYEGFNKAKEKSRRDKEAVS